MPHCYDSTCCDMSVPEVLLKQLNESSWLLARVLRSTYPTLCFKEIWISPKLGYFSLELIAFSALTLLVGRQEGHHACKKLSGGVLAWLSVWSELQTCIWPSRFHCYSLSLASVKSRLVLSLWYRRGTSWWRGTVVERRSLAGELSLSCA